MKTKKIVLDKSLIDLAFENHGLNIQSTAMQLEDIYSKLIDNKYASRT